MSNGLHNGLYNGTLNGLSNGLFGSDKIIFTSEVISLFNRMTVQPSLDRKLLISTTYNYLKDSGILKELEYIYFFAAHDRQAAKLNWKQPLYNAVEFGSVNFVQDRGFKRNGSVGGATDGIDTGFIHANGTISTKNSSSFGIYSRTNANEATADFGSITSSFLGCSINPRSGGNSQIRNATISAANAAVPDSLGLISSVRNLSTAFQNYKRGVQISAPTFSSVGTSPFNDYILTVNVNGSPNFGSSRQIAFAYRGSGNIDQVALNRIVEYYMAGIGASV